MNRGLKFFILTAAMSALFNFNGMSQQTARKLSLNESIKIGLENSNFLHSSKMKVLNAEAKLKESNSYMLPSLKFNALYTRLSDIPAAVIATPFGNFPISPTILNNYTLKLSLQQPIFTGFKLSGASNLAENSALAQKEDYNKDEQDLIYNIKNSYWSVYKAKKFKEVVDENVNQVKAHLQDVTNLSNQGLATKNDVLKVEVQLSEAQLRQIDANNSVRLNLLALVNTIGLPISTVVDVTDEIGNKVEVIKDIDVFINKAYDNRPELKSMNYRVKAGENGVTIAQSGWWPQLYLAGNYNYARPNQRVFPTKDEFKGTWDVSLNLQFDIWNWGQTSSQTTQAETQLEQAKDGYKIIKDNITLEVTQNYLNIIQSKEKMVVSQSSVGQAEENYRITNEKFKNGLITNSELLDAEVALLQARTNYLQSLVDYELAKARLEKSSGESSIEKL